MGIFFAKVNHFGKFDDYVDVNKYLDWNTKRAALDASPYVVALRSHIGCQWLFICSGTIVNSCGANGEFFYTILTSATLLRCPTTEDSVADDIKVELRSPACDAGICTDDIIVQIDGKHVESSSE
ncbi:hypothetical protein OROGR_012089 [Orobanche gracilis]